MSEKGIVIAKLHIAIDERTARQHISFDEGNSNGKQGEIGLLANRVLD